MTVLPFILHGPPAVGLFLLELLAKRFHGVFGTGKTGLEISYCVRVGSASRHSFFVWRLRIDWH